jgi:AcrR family transcriptional regulator
MKTRDRILATSLILFNEEGEQNVTTVDIANEMDISPGNLYYHFHGKESIIEELYNNYDAELTSLLRQSISDPLSLEDHWFFLYVIFEEVYKFRFFYLNSGDLILRYHEIERRFRRLINIKIFTIEELCKNLIGRENPMIEEIDMKFLAENIAMSLIYWFPYQHLLHPELDSSELIHKGVYHILSLLAPYCGDHQREFITTVQKLYKSNVGK